jgi:hypothetical protein
MFEVHESAFDMVDVKRTAHATPLPPGSEHKMQYEYLATPLEEHSGSAATIKQHMAAIRMMFFWLTEKGILAINPAREVKTPKFSGPKARRPSSAPKKFKKSSLPSIRVTSSAIGTKRFLLRWLIHLPGSARS